MHVHTDMVSLFCRIFVAKFVLFLFI